MVCFQVVSNFPAVLHHFFLERFSQPAQWFEARTAYTRSTAVNSMAGFIIGLGDRHMGNILIDLASAEVRSGPAAAADACIIRV
jgi:ataxia telangiectasia mutated family protein